jgi:hypothetical protein
VLFWYVGGTLAVTRYSFRDDRMDVRLLIVGALLPGLIDAPVGVLWFESFRAVQLFGHSLVFAALVMTVIVVRTRRGRPRKRWMPLAIGMLVHLILDGMWAHPETLFWPFLGFRFSPGGFDTIGALVVGTLSDWKAWAREGAGVVYLTYLIRAGDLTSATGWSRFRATGRIDVAIDRR